MIKFLLNLYGEYLNNTKKERTKMWTNLDEGKDYGKKKPIELKGDLDGFMIWLYKNKITWK